MEEYRTKDLFQPHPNVPNAWCWRSRADDIIVFLNGEKTNPVAMEQHILSQHSDLGGALVVGTQRFQSALLIEPAALNDPLNTFEQAALIEKIWPTVQEANNFVPAHAKVEKSLILVVDRPMIRSGKGTIQRAASVQQYSADVEALYTNADVTADGEYVSGEASWNSTDAATVTRVIHDSVYSVIGRSVPAQSSFFDYGMDSLLALQILRLMRRGLHRSDLGLSTIYSNPSVDQLSNAVTAQHNELEKNSDALLMQPMLDTYRALLAQIPSPGLPSQESKAAPVAAMLTGSTGTIGTFLLKALLDHPGIEHVFCLNRSEDGGRAAQKLRMTARGMDLDDLNERVTFLQSDLSHPRLELGDNLHEELRARVGLIIHNAWPVNFNLRLTAFRPQLAGMLNLFRLSVEASSAGRMVPFIFISSVSAVRTEGHVGGNEAAPERVLSMNNAPQANGYAQSKFLAEMLCASASHALRIPVTIARVGQVAGAVQVPGDEWNRNEWFPSLSSGLCQWAVSLQIWDPNSQRSTGCRWICWPASSSTWPWGRPTSTWRMLAVHVSIICGTLRRRAGAIYCHPSLRRQRSSLGLITRLKWYRHRSG